MSSTNDNTNDDTNGGRAEDLFALGAELADVCGRTGRRDAGRSTRDAWRDRATLPAGLARLLEAKGRKPPTVPDSHELAREPEFVPVDESQKLPGVLVDDGNAVVAIAGSAGTGKTQAAVNLVCRAVGQGKRVLVTSNAIPALEAFQRRLPDGFLTLAEKNDAWKHLGDSSADSKSLEQQLKRIEKQAAGIEQDLAAAAAEERTSFSIVDDHFQGTPAKIINQIKQQQERFKWFRDRVKPDQTMPVTLEELFEIQASYRDAAELAKARPNPQVLPGIDEFQDAVDREAVWAKQLNEARRLANPGLLRTLAERELAAPQADELLEMVTNLIDRKTRLLQEGGPPWLKKAIEDSLAARQFPWIKASNRTNQFVKSYGRQIEAIEEAGVVVPSDVNYRQLSTDALTLRNYLREGGKLNLVAKLNPKLRSVLYITTRVTVQGYPCDTDDRLKAVLDYAEMRGKVDKIFRLWRDAGVEDTFEEGLESALNQLKSLTASFTRVRPLHELQESLVAKLNDSSRGAGWKDAADPEWLFNGLTAYRCELQHRAAGEAFRPWTDAFHEIDSSNAHRVVSDLQRAISNRDVAAFQKGLDTLQALEKAERRRERVKPLSANVAEVARDLSERLSRAAVDRQLDEHLQEIEPAWRFARARSWAVEFLRNRPDATQFDQLARLRRDRMLLLSRLSAGRAARAYDARSSSADRADKSRESSPLHISLADDVLQRGDCTGDSPPFDLVVIEDGSRCGLDLAPLLVAGEEIVITGDAEHPPLDGCDLDRWETFRAERAVEFRAAEFGVEASLFDVAIARASCVVPLETTYRSVQAIDGWVAARFDSGRELTSLRPPQAGVWPSLVSLRVVCPAEGNVDPATARAAVDRISRQLTDPSFASQTFCVIAESAAQADAIQKLIDDRALSRPERPVACGTVDEFQGQQFDVVVVVLEQVSTSATTATGDASRTIRQRLRMAISRARNQVVFVHALPDDVRDFRRELIDSIDSERPVPSLERFDPSTDAQKIVAECARRVQQQGYTVFQPPNPVAVRAGVVFVVGSPGNYVAIVKEEQRGDRNTYGDRLRLQSRLRDLGWSFWYLRPSRFVEDLNRECEQLFGWLSEAGVKESQDDNSALACESLTAPADWLEPIIEVAVEREADATTETEGAVEPEAKVAAEPEVPAEPEAEIVAESGAAVAEEREDEAAAETEAAVAIAPEDESAAADETGTAAEPEADVSAEPEVTVAIEPETDLAAAPETEGTVEPEAAVATEPEADATTEPEAELADKPEDELRIEVLATVEPEEVATDLAAESAVAEAADDIPSSSRVQQAEPPSEESGDESRSDEPRVIEPSPEPVAPPLEPVVASREPASESKPHEDVAFTLPPRVEPRTPLTHDVLQDSENDESEFHLDETPLDTRSETHDMTNQPNQSSSKPAASPAPAAKATTSPTSVVSPNTTAAQSPAAQTPPQQSPAPRTPTQQTPAAQTPTAQPTTQRGGGSQAAVDKFLDKLKSAGAVVRTNSRDEPILIDLRPTTWHDDELDNELKPLVECRTVRELYLPVQTTDTNLVNLSGLADLEFVSLAYSSITDRAIGELRRFPQLKDLDLRFTRVTDGCFQQLKQIDSLRKVNVHATRVDRTVISKMQERVPTPCSKTGVPGLRFSVAFLLPLALLLAASVAGCSRHQGSGSTQSLNAIGPDLELKDESGRINCVAWTPDGKMIATACENGAFVIWDVASQKVHCKMNAGVGEVGAIAFTPESWLVTGHADGHIRVWDFKKRLLTSPAAIIPAHSAAVTSLCCPIEEIIVSGSEDTSVCCWEKTEKGWEPRNGWGSRSQAHGLAVTSVTAVWHSDRFQSRRAKLKSLGPNALSTVAGFDPYITLRIASSSLDASVVVWDEDGNRNMWLSGQDTVDRLRPHEDRIQEVRLSPDARKLISVGSDGEVRFADVETGRRYQFEFEMLEHGGAAHTEPIHALDLAPDGMVMATADIGGMIRVWNTEGAMWDGCVKGNMVRELHTSFGHRWAVNSLRFRPKLPPWPQSKVQLCSGGSDATTRTWTVQTNVAPHPTTLSGSPSTGNTLPGTTAPSTPAGTSSPGTTSSGTPAGTTPAGSTATNEPFHNPYTDSNFLNIEVTSPFLLLIDKSDGMGEWMPEIQNQVQELVTSLQNKYGPTPIYGNIIFFNDGPPQSVLAGIQDLSGINLTNLHTAVNSVTIQGKSDLIPALQRAQQEIQGFTPPGTTSGTTSVQVVLVTDGVFDASPHHIFDTTTGAAVTSLFSGMNGVVLDVVPARHAEPHPQPHPATRAELDLAKLALWFGGTFGPLPRKP